LALSSCGVEPAKQVNSVSASSTPATTPASMPAASSFAYPRAQSIEQFDTYHGTRVADPYRWLETLDSPDTKRWIEAQNALAQPYLEAIPAREHLKKRMTQLWNYERYDIPLKRGNRYFYLRNDGLQNQSVLYITEQLDAKARALLDP